MSDQIKLKEIEAQYPQSSKSKKIWDWDVYQISGNAKWGSRVNYSIWEDGSGFEAVFTSDMSQGSDEPKEETEVEVVFHLAAFYDGARHMYFNIYDKEEGCKGYLYYPNIPQLIKALQFVDHLQTKHCEHYEP
jgi:hypothetical protein